MRECGFLSSWESDNIQWWYKLLQQGNGRSLFLRPEWSRAQNIAIALDAAGRSGFAAICGKQWFWGAWPLGTVQLNIACKELVPIFRHSTCCPNCGFQLDSSTNSFSTAALVPSLNQEWPHLLNNAQAASTNKSYKSAQRTFLEFVTVQNIGLPSGSLFPISELTNHAKHQQLKYIYQRLEHCRLTTGFLIHYWEVYVYPQ